jgi:putative oxidoreductase
MFVGSVEMVGGILLILGLASRLISIPLSITMIVAYLTAHKEEVTSIFSEPDKFIGASPFLFLMVTLIIVAFGPGLLSLDALISKKFGGDPATDETKEKRSY